MIHFLKPHLGLEKKLDDTFFQLLVSGILHYIGSHLILIYKKENILNDTFLKTKSVSHFTLLSVEAKYIILAKPHFWFESCLIWNARGK